MILAKEDLVQIYDGLKHNFLYNNDINSIHILLNLYDLEDNMVNICPKYITTQEIRKKIRRLLVYKKSRQLISNNIVLLIHEDIDRLELIMHLEGYKYGYYNSKWVNILEDAALKYCSIVEIYDNNFLFHHSTSFKEIEKIKKDFEIEIKNKEKETNTLGKAIHTYCEKVIKNKIYNLDKYTDKQLTIECDSNEMNIKEEEPYLSLVELNKIYNNIVKTITKNAIMSFGNASWYGVNDRVLNRYR
ncbi:MAG: hypothetical protein GX981_09100 [Tissierellia bacterium]|nr:hypothetical protein [Tissierellia bacterium]